MFIDDAANVLELASASGFTIFSLENPQKIIEAFPKKQTFLLDPATAEKPGKITIGDIRNLIDLCQTKQTKAFYSIILDAEKMNEQAENALLKLLEEPRENFHFVLLTNAPSTLLPTILSRANLYVERIKNRLNSPILADSEQKIYAKRIITAKKVDLPHIFEQISKEKLYKKDARGYLMNIVETAIEITYKSYFKTHNLNFVAKLQKLLVLSDNLKQNGHIKLHFVADLC